MQMRLDRPLGAVEYSAHLFCGKAVQMAHDHYRPLHRRKLVEGTFDVLAYIGSKFVLEIILQR